MTRAAAASILTAAIIIAIYETRTPDTTVQHDVQVITETKTETVYTDLDDLREAFARTAEELRSECLYIIQRTTGDPMPGIIHHVDRHYQGDACRAADEAINGGW
jgi:hypothetical protein